MKPPSKRALSSRRRFEARREAGMPGLAPAVALALTLQSAAAQTPDDATRAYMLCVRRNAEFLEPSGDPPQDVARAAVFVCHREELAAFNAVNRPAGAPPDSNALHALRNSALFYGAGQATVARACRVAQRCGLAPLSSSN